MSAKAFREVMKNIPELKSWATGQQDTSSVLHQTRGSSKQEIKSSIVDFVLPIADLERVVGNKQLADQIFNLIKVDITASGTEFIEVFTPSNGTQSIVFKNIRFDTLNQKIASILEEYSGVQGLSVGIEQNIQNANYDKGHVYGWANTLVERTKQSIGKTLTLANRRDPKTNEPIKPEQLQKELDGLNKFIDSLLDALEELDEAASSLGQDLKAPIFAKYKKTDSNWLIQWQGSAAQQKAGSGVGTVVGKSSNTGIRGFLNSVGYQSGDNLLEKAMQGMIKGFVDQGLSNSNLANLESSPPLIKLVEDTLVSAITGKPKKYAKEHSGNINAVDLKLQSVSGVSQAKSSIGKAKAKLKGTKAEVAKTKASIIVQTMQSYSLPDLQQLINSLLAKTIKENMGTGNRRDILNLRTGRFAESAKVERMTQSREGMITAFYSYMRNPYGTFSEGGRQESPKSRDPKLLIAKSIREIAETQVKNRLRAVLV
jgi:hypothetical protein